jgi:predicted permease
VQLVSGGFFRVLGIEPVRGRVFGPAEDKVQGADPVGVISWKFWQRDFAGDPGILGRTLRIGKGTFHIIGITPEGFRGIEAGSETDIWIQIAMQQQALPGRDYLTPRDTLWLQVMGRLQPGISRGAAQASVNVALQQILRNWHVRDLNQRIRLRAGARGASEIRDQFSDPLLVLMAMVGLVLLIACANSGNLMLARARGRRREIGVRLALGAARPRLIRQITTESMLIAAMGGALGTLLAMLGTRALLAFASASVSDLALDASSDFRVLLFTAAASLTTGILVGLVPALRETRIDLSQTLSMNQRRTAGSRVRGGRILVVAQIALSIILVTGAALLARSLRNMLVEKVGFDRGRLLQVVVDPFAAGYKGASLTALYQQVLIELRRIPGARDVTVANQDLFGGGDSGDRISLDGSPVHNPDELRSRWTLVGPNYFATLGIPLLRGRQIYASDAARGARFCVVNEAFARQFYPGSDPIGRHLTDEYPTTRETYEIIGVAANAKEHRPDEPVRARFYASLFHPIGTSERAVFVIATAGDPAAAGNAVRAVLARAAPNLPVTGIRTVDDQLGRRLVTQRLIADLSGCFGILGLFMAAIGIYGVMSYSISRRTSEIGIRMALGASGVSVTRMVLKETCWLVVAGAAIGVPCAYAASRLTGSMLFGLKPGDPSALAIALAVILTVSGAAAYLPARRASRVDPMNALRCD